MADANLPERFAELVRKLDVPASNTHVENTGDQFRVLQDEIERLFGELQILRQG